MIQAVKGMKDVGPEDSSCWQALETVCRKLTHRYGYKEVRFPLLEQTALFKRTIGEVTDIIEKEMYTFDDRNGDSLSLRPEGTAGCVRAGVQGGWFYNQVQRLWYLGPMFRHERPQRGRLRQFHQLGFEAYGMVGAAIDAEMITMTHNLWQALKLVDVRLEINCLGSYEARQAYRTLLIDYYRGQTLDEDSQRRLSSNPLRILDSKNPAMQAVNANAPKLLDHLDDASKTEFAELCHMLDALGIVYTVNPCLVRGLDYYNQTVFEWVTDALGAQGTVCAGGRYDSLVERLGGKPTPAVGCAVGLERLLELLAWQKTAIADVYGIVADPQAVTPMLVLTEALRERFPAWQVVTHLAGGSLKSQFKKADKAGARFALILGVQELQNKTVTVKNLQTGEQQTVALEMCFDLLGE